MIVVALIALAVLGLAYYFYTELVNVQKALKTSASNVGTISSQLQQVQLDYSTVSDSLVTETPYAVSFDYDGVSKWVPRDGVSVMNGNNYTVPRDGTYLVSAWGNLTTNPTVQNTPQVSAITLNQLSGDQSRGIGNAYHSIYIGLSNSIGGNIKETIDVTPSGVRTFKAGDIVRIAGVGTYTFFYLHIIRLSS